MKLQVGKAYRLYAKAPTVGRFHPVDVNRGGCVGNLIYATIFEVNDQARADELGSHIEGLREDNPGWAFEYRVVPGFSETVGHGWELKR